LHTLRRQQPLHIQALDLRLDAAAGIGDLVALRGTRGGQLYDSDFAQRMRGTGPYAELLARRFAVADQVQFAGWIEPVKRFEFIADFDICMLPLSATSIGSRYTSPLKLFEYMAMGKPVVAPALPSVHEVLPPQHFGAFQARPEDPADIARVVNLLIARPELRHAYGRQLGELSQRFTWSQRAGRMVEVMRSGCTALNA